MTERRNTLIKYATGQSHLRQPQDYKNKTFLITLSILDYYLQTSSSPPFGHVNNI
ncbi:hypothetical protein NEAUS05_2578 [Nematocida ausubeli]|nr:hypothetical protein NEAUS07_2562 [Nematocida ausubeli]KAI5151725.1 hypothetical protein NEAUS05_2578 [Nematocida ausubeli]